MISVLMFTKPQRQRLVGVWQDLVLLLLWTSVNHYELVTGS